MSGDLTRRAFVGGAAASAGVALGGCGATSSGASPASKAAPPSDAERAGLDTGTPWADTGVATPSCWDTQDFAEGPYYLADAPQRADLRTAGEEGIILVLTGTVRSVGSCARLPDALVELWHCDQEGTYDLDTGTMHYRTAVRTGFDGTFRVTTLRPVSYIDAGSGNRMPQHFHLKIRAQGHDDLVTQLRFADDPDRDPTFPSVLELTPTQHGDGSESAHFDFALT